MVMVLVMTGMTFGLLPRPRRFEIVTAMETTADAELTKKEYGASSLWLNLAAAGIVILIAVPSCTHFGETKQFGKLALILANLVFFYFHCTSRVVHDWYKKRDHAGYYAVAFTSVALAMYLGSHKTQPWLLAMPLVSQVVLDYPRGEILPRLAAIYIICLYPLGWMWLNAVLGLASGFAFTAIFSWMLRRENERRSELNAAHEKLREFTAKAEALAAAEERTRLAREIHDGVAHHLTSANILVEASLATLPEQTSAQTRDALKKAQGQIRSALSEIRNSIAERRDAAAQIPLQDRVQKLIHDGDFPATLQILGELRRFSPEAEQGLYRVAQEALTNAAKHAPGAAITLVLDFCDAGRVRLRASNPEPKHSPSGDGAFGLLSLRERIHHLGGNFSAGADATGLFVVQAEIPA